MRISDALRREGLGEREVARKLAAVIDRQTPDQPEEEANDKLLAGVLMNCFRYLDDGSRKPGTGTLPLAVTLTHDVPRPARAGKDKKQRQKGNDI
jgi:hypothetical protein